jgi:hypothetical protein
MHPALSRWATPSITGLFVVSLISGIAIFFGLGRGYFTGMHEWLSMLLVIPFALHLWKNWRPFVAYLRRPPMAVASALSLAAALAFVIPAALSTSGPPPERAVIQLLPSRTIAQVAPLFGHTGETLAVALANGGLAAASADATLAEVAEASDASTGRVLAVALAARR